MTATEHIIDDTLIEATATAYWELLRLRDWWPDGFDSTPEGSKEFYRKQAREILAVVVPRILERQS